MWGSQFSRPVWRRPVRVALSDQPDHSAGARGLAVVGGGLQGLSAAYFAALKGLSVRVIEARALGERASGLNGGQVDHGLKFDPDWILEHLGEAHGHALIDFSAQSADVVFDLIAAHGLDVEHARSGWIYAAHTQAALASPRNGTGNGARGADVLLLSGRKPALLTGTAAILAAGSTGGPARSIRSPSRSS